MNSLVNNLVNHIPKVCLVDNKVVYYKLEAYTLLDTSSMDVYI